MTEQQQDLGTQLPFREGKYARVERERRFLLASPPALDSATAVRRVTDRYLDGTRLRLRLVELRDSGGVELKLTQKVAADRPGPVQGLITNIYLSPDEYDRLLALPAATLRKTRYSFPPLGVDVFDAPLHGLVLAEAEFDSDEEASAFPPPPGTLAEVTDDPRFTGGRLVRTERPELLVWLAEFVVSP
ncbi:hypothetical protein ACFYNO_34965 [Kitasatospora sp. NPDC006697]|uniref:hypothetical protein n=1 Tax=Kitasatospora sp. NPDC006697 TaxID=3364020 RepID=UPI003692BBC0